jgi:hypothetical protein
MVENLEARIHLGLFPGERLDIPVTHDPSLHMSAVRPRDLLAYWMAPGCWVSSV